MALGFSDGGVLTRLTLRPTFENPTDGGDPMRWTLGPTFVPLGIQYEFHLKSHRNSQDKASQKPIKMASIFLTTLPLFHGFDPENKASQEP